MSEQGERLCLRDAFDYVKHQRFLANPNRSFLCQLAQYEMKLHDGKTSISGTSLKRWNFYELQEIKAKKKGALKPRLKIKSNISCSIM
jgi:hypothetical protein